MGGAMQWTRPPCSTKDCCDPGTAPASSGPARRRRRWRGGCGGGGDQIVMLGRDMRTVGAQPPGRIKLKLGEAVGRLAPPLHVHGQVS